MRTNQYTYTEYTTGEKELYDNTSDPVPAEEPACQCGNSHAEDEARLSDVSAGDLPGETCRTIENEDVP